MANISTYTTLIKGASRGEDVRDAIISAAKEINIQGIENANTLDGMTVDEFLLSRELFTTDYYDDTPKRGSIKYVTSEGLWEALDDISLALDRILGEFDNE